MGQKQQIKRLTEIIHENWCIAFILFLAILGAYYESLPYPFLNLDDPFYINNDPYIRDLTWKGLYRIFTQPIVTNYFPLQILSYSLDYRIWHIHPFGYRLHNVVLHVLNAILVFLLLKKIFSNQWVAFLSALFFGLHPVNVESVTWVAERKNVLSMAFLLSSFLTYLYYLDETRRSRKFGFYAVCLFLFLLALFAKVSAVVLPALFLLFDLCFRKRKKWEMVRDKIPFVAFAILFSFIAVWVYHRGNYLIDYHGGSPFKTSLAMINVFVEYIIYLIVPVYLDHFYLTPIPQSILERQVLLSIASIFLIALLAWRSFRGDRIFFFWAGWYLISLLPVLNIVPLSILRADRYMYLPAIGFFYLISLGLWKVNWRYHRPLGHTGFLICFLLLAGIYAFLTMERNRVWKDPITFWEENLRKFPQSADAYRYIGSVYMNRGKTDLAISYFHSGLKEDPNNVILLSNLAAAHFNKRDLKKAKGLLLEAIRINPNVGLPYINLGAIYWQKGEAETAKSCFQRAVEVDPQSAYAHTSLGGIYCNLDQLEEAIRETEKSLELAPGYIEPWMNMALVYEKKKCLDKAESYLKRGLDYVPDSQAGLFMLARICWEQGKKAEATFYANRAHGLNPNMGNNKPSPSSTGHGNVSFASKGTGNIILTTKTTDPLGP